MNQTETPSAPMATSCAPQASIDALIERLSNAVDTPASETYWVGNDVLVCKPGTDWENASHTSPRENTGKTWVVTEFAGELSWVFEALDRILTEHGLFTRGERRDFYTHLAEYAIEFLGRSSAGEQDFAPGARARSLLFFTLQSARRLLDQSAGRSR